MLRLTNIQLWRNSPVINNTFVYSTFYFQILSNSYYVDTLETETTSLVLLIDILI